MEIKILCACGTKFKFDVEPVNRRMPSRVNCPACGADATDQANAAIESAVSSAPAQPVPANPPGTLRINRPSAPPSEASTGAAPPLRTAPARVASPRPGGEAKNPLVKVDTSILVVACIVFGAWRLGVKWYKRINLVARVASVVGEAGVGGEDGSAEGAKNLWYEKCAMLFIKHTNHLEVAEGCKDYWQTKLHKNLALIDLSREYMEPGEYELIPAHNGYVRIIGGHEWPEPEHEGLAKFLSEKFGTLVFEWREESFADTYHFGVYDQGIRKFHAQMDIKMSGDEPQEIVTTEGNDFAIANGFKPGPEGFKEFGELDADKITQRLGLKIWDEKEGAEVKTMLLKEGALAAGSR